MNIRFGLLFLSVFVSIDISGSYIDEMRKIVREKMLVDLEAAGKLTGQKSEVAKIEAELEHDFSSFGLDCVGGRYFQKTVQKIVGSLTCYSFALGGITKDIADDLFVKNITMSKGEIHEVASILFDFVAHDKTFVDRYDNARKNFFLNQYFENQRRVREEEAKGEEVDVVTPVARTAKKLIPVDKKALQVDDDFCCSCWCGSHEKNS